MNRRQLIQLQIATHAAVQAALVNKGRSKPQFAAQMAKEHAQAAVREYSNGKRKS
jgi:hypothetical protein